MEPICTHSSNSFLGGVTGFISSAMGAFGNFFGGSSASAATTSNAKSTSASGLGAFQSNLSVAQQRFGIPSDWVPALTQIVKNESGFNPSAQNKTSTAYGYAQFLSSTRASYEKKMGISYSDPVNQIGMMAQYLKDRYGTAQNALAFWNKNHWY